MPRYIPYLQMQKLREAAKNGDERAKKILMSQLNDDCDFSCDLDDYFKPQPEPEEIPEKQPETEQVQAQQEEQEPTPEVGDISQAILKLISLCDEKTLEIANNTELSDATKKGALSILGEIKQSGLDNLEKFGKLMNSITEKVEKKEENIYNDNVEG